MKKFIYKFAIILLIGIMLISSYFIFKELKQNKEQENTFDELLQIIEDSNENEQEENKNQVTLNSLYEINNDLIGWIRIENTTIDYPVMKSNIKNYYLRKDFYKKYSSYGTPFLADGCDKTSDNIIIYGHHMMNSKMFGALEAYKSKDFYNSHKIIDFYTLQDNETIKDEYEIFSVFKTVLYDSNSFKYYNYINFNSKIEFNSFINKTKELSLYNTEITPQYGDKLITLSTCEYSHKNGRLVVVARQIGGGNYWQILK